MSQLMCLLGRQTHSRRKCYMLVITTRFSRSVTSKSNRRD
jgi:hypothetical protein